MRNWNCKKLDVSARTQIYKHTNTMKNQIHLYYHPQTIIHTNGSVSSWGIPDLWKSGEAKKGTISLHANSGVNMAPVKPSGSAGTALLGSPLRDALQAISQSFFDPFHDILSIHSKTVMKVSTPKRHKGYIAVADVDVYSNELWNGSRQKVGSAAAVEDTVLFKFKKRYASY